MPCHQAFSETRTSRAILTCHVGVRYTPLPSPSRRQPRLCRLAAPLLDGALRNSGL